MEDVLKNAMDKLANEGLYVCNMTHRPELYEIYDEDMKVVDDYLDAAAVIERAKAQNVKDRDFKFEYQLLSRLKEDCNYYLGASKGFEPHLWAHTVEAQIEKMKELHKGFPEEGKPEWLTWEDILEYETKMCKVKTAKTNLEALNIINMSYSDGYLHFMILSDDYQMEGLYRIFDPDNGIAKTLVTIDYGYLHPEIKEKWDEIEKTLTEYAEVLYAEQRVEDEKIKQSQAELSVNEDNEENKPVIPLHRRKGGR